MIRWKILFHPKQGVQRGWVKRKMYSEYFREERIATITEDFDDDIDCLGADGECPREGALEVDQDHLAAGLHR
jgi:hypothetical protein